MEEPLFDDATAPAQTDYVTCYDIEESLAAAGLSCVAGVDEVGRGAWAGPVTVCAVIVRPGFPTPPQGLTDSKLLSASRREAIAGQLSLL